MLLDFREAEEKVMKNFNGGEKEFRARMLVDKNNKILMGRLIPGASIGMHRHENTSEIIYVLSGCGRMLTEQGEEKLEAGCCHYCPEGQSHSFINDSDEDVVFFAVVPNHGA